MKLVSKYWQEIKDNKELIEKYEYLSLRDREAYAILRRFYNQELGQIPEDSGSQGIQPHAIRVCTQRSAMAKDLGPEGAPLVSDSHSDAKHTCTAVTLPM
jgi:hypothetical protein